MPLQHICSPPSEADLNEAARASSPIDSCRKDRALIFGGRRRPIINQGFAVEHLLSFEERIGLLYSGRRAIENQPKALRLST